ncbi:hypothetical protein M408DRAFT_325611 [Serendipita vermifera MAFF 305830]|uniref:Dipeptidyl aminopeptidase n=1 Tax=Serendipita vermifera MAFF 305830 TaxID=933852 RepID=A0A0C3BPV9_SERVB|nr:hypothetical protein M408DRAFT_325611 [Serendipita vermifera MAFF 305830]
MSNPRYEPLSQAEDVTIIPKQSNSISLYDLRAGEASREAYEGRSSSEEEDEQERMKLQEGSLYIEDLEDDQPHKESRPNLRRYFLWGLGAILLCATLIGIVAARSYNGEKFRIKGRKHLTMDTVFNGTFYSMHTTVHWVPQAGDGVFSIDHSGEILLVDLKSNTTRSLVKHSAVKDEHGRQLVWSEWKLSPDAKYILFQADRLKGWRHSSFGNYYVHDLARGITEPLVAPSDPPVVSYATWAPTHNSIAYVSKNDLYVVSSPGEDSVRITEGGNSTIFHAIPDWVYEEEVFSSNSALWWSPDSSKMVFLRFDETDVNEFTFPIYNPTYNADSVVPYPKHVTMRYPKPGYANPLVSVHVFDLNGYLTAVEDGSSSALSRHTWELSWEDQRPQTDSIIQEVAWVDDKSLIVKEINRSGNAGSVVLFNLDYPTRRGSVVRRLGKNGEEGDDGWIEPSQRIRPLEEQDGGGSNGYLDVLPNKDGFNHIALFSPADSSVPIWLTTGPWEVTSDILGVDNHKGLVYFVAASPSSIDRNVYSAKIPNLTSKNSTPEAPQALTDSRQPSWYSASFSPRSGFYALSYSGPGVPWQKIMQINKPEFNYLLNDNRELNVTSAKYQMPNIVRSTIMSDGYELNTMEIQPPSMDESGRTKYPVLFRVYGGPSSQMVHTRWERDWHHYLACSMKYIIVVVDGRGTGFKGRKLRNPVKGNLGQHEVQDQINAAKHWAAKRYVDSRKIGIWGWSYGGFMSSKVVEAGAGVHSLAMAVAPVTSWRLYDSIYTERYMGTPQNNADGYVNASVSNVEGFRHVDFLLAHGSGDDNVHFANSAHLLDMFTAAQIRRFRFRMFTDSDHSIQVRGAYRELHEWMTEFLLEKWGTGGYRRGW